MFENKDLNENLEYTLPSFDELVCLAETQPVEFETLRTLLCNELIEQAPESIQMRLKGLQFTIDMERKKNKPSLFNCQKISNMMSESLQELQDALSNPEEYLRNQAIPKPRAGVIPLFPKR